MHNGVALLSIIAENYPFGIELYNNCLQVLDFIDRASNHRLITYADTKDLLGLSSETTRMCHMHDSSRLHLTGRGRHANIHLTNVYTATEPSISLDTVPQSILNH